MNTKKTRLLSILFAFALSMIGIDAFAWDIAVKNSDGITIFYNWLNATDLEVAQGSYSGNVVIPEKVTYNGNTFSVTRIGAYAFSNRTSLTSVTIPKSVTSIGIAAFDGCSGLTSVNITDIAAWCRISFDLTGSDMPNYLANPLYFAHHLYLNGEEIKNLEIPSSVNSIGRMVFYGCNEIVSVTIPNSVTTIGFDAFHDCSGLTSVNIPNSVTSIGGYAFSGCSGLASIKVESGNSKYDSRNNCNAIIHTESNVLITGCKNTFIPNSVTSIGDYAFQGHDGLTSVTIPNSVTSIGKRAFNRCTNLTSVTVEMGTPLSIDAYTFSNRANATLYVPAGYKATYLVADYWKEFKKIVEMEDTSPAITFADANVKSLCVLKWDTNGDGELSEAEARVVTQLGSLFSNKTITSFNELKYFKGLTSIENGAFNNCSYLTSVTIPDAVTSIGGSAFNSCSSLTSVTIGNSVTSIGHEAFYNCRSLTSVTIPNSVTSIGNAAFQGCSGLTSVTIGNSVTSIGKNAFSGCMNLTSVNITDIAAWCNISFDVIMDQKTVFTNGANPLEYAGHLYLNGKEIKDLVIPNSVTSIGNYTFVCSGLTSVTIPNSVTSIGNAAFQGCISLTSITIPNSVTSIGRCAFDSCEKLTSVTIPNSVTSIEGGVFQGCTNLTSVTIPNSVTSIEEFAFALCIGLTSVTIPSSVTSIGEYAFYMTNLTEIYSMNSDPFEVNSNCWYNVNKEIPLYVPVGSKEKYLATAGWNEFNIIELGVSTNNTLAMDNLIGYVGKTITLPILMNNEQQITGLQFDICLPEGVTVAKKANGKNDITVTERMEESYSLSSNTMEDGSVRVTGLSGESIPFTGNSGAIVNVVLQVDEAVAEGDYKIQAKNIILSDVSGVAHKPTTASCTLTIKSYILGDVDDSGDININDAVCIVNYILNKPNAKFIPEAADLDGSGDININDAVVLINKYILKRANAKAMKAPRRAATGTDNYLSLGAISIKPGETKTVSVDMTNTEGIQGLQCSIDLPEGLSFATKSNGKIDIANNTDRGDGFTLSTSLQEDGSLTVATVNFEGDSYYGNSGTIFTFKIKADENMAAGEYEIKVCDIVLSSGVAIKPSDAIGKVTVEGSSSGLQQIDADSNQSDSIYNLNGQRVKKPNHGVYIHNRKKVIVE